MKWSEVDGDRPHRLQQLHGSQSCWLGFASLLCSLAAALLSWLTLFALILHFSAKSAAIFGEKSSNLLCSKYRQFMSTVDLAVPKISCWTSVQRNWRLSSEQVTLGAGLHSTHSQRFNLKAKPWREMVISGFYVPPIISVFHIIQMQNSNMQFLTKINNLQITSTKTMRKKMIENSFKNTK